MTASEDQDPEIVPTPTTKRLLDVVGSAAAIIVLSPLLATTAAGIRLTMGSPILFSQERGGLGGTRFRILKFRSMTDLRDSQGNLLPDKLRRHWFGNILRATSIDEAPALLNILRGEMSLVGPRPLMSKYLDRYSPEQSRRHTVTPGLTGLAQIRGRNLLSWDEKFALDLTYIDTRTLMLDLRILAETLLAAARRDGADGIDHTEEFFGPAS